MNIRAVDIGYFYGEKEVLKGVSLEAGEGDVISIIGPVGAGKTTLLKILSLIMKPARGKVYINDTDTSKNPLPLRRKIGFVHQSPFFFSGTVYDNLSLPLSLRGIRDKKRVERFLEEFGLSGLRGRKASELSGGEARRLSIARALIHDPEILILDEPMTNLDPEGLGILERRIKEFEGPVIMATHDLDEARRISKRFLFLLGGVIFEEGSPEEILERPKLKETLLFTGRLNILEGEIKAKEEGMDVIELGGERVYGISGLEVGRRVMIAIRPEDIVVEKERRMSTRNILRGRIKGIIRKGPVVEIEIDSLFPLRALLTAKSLEEMNLSAGDEVYLLFKATALRVFPKD